MTESFRRVAIIQARMSSTRFPGKVLAPLGELPMIAFMVERVRKAKMLDQVIVATSTESSDDPLVATLTERGIDCFRGSLHDVLDRFACAARASKAEHVVRLTGDCPLMDADLIDRCLGELSKGDADYVSNVQVPTFPNGLDVECFTIGALETAWREARLQSEREHVTPFIRKGGGGLRVSNWTAVADLSGLRWTVDHLDDLEHVTQLVRACAKTKGTPDPSSFDRFDVLREIEHHALGFGAAHDRHEGYLKSLAADI